MTQTQDRTLRAPDPFAVERPKLYSIGGIDIATFLCSWFAGAFLIARNYHQFGKPESARNALLLGFAGIVCLSFAVFSVVVPERYEQALSAAIQGIQVLMVHLLAKRLQGRALSNHVELGGTFYSRWRAAGVAVLLLPVVLALMVAVALAFPQLPGIAK